MFAEHYLVSGQPDRLGRHDLVGLAVREDAVLVDAGLMGEGVLADDGLVGLNAGAGDRRDEARGCVDPGGIDVAAQVRAADGAKVDCPRAMAITISSGPRCRAFAAAVFVHSTWSAPARWPPGCWRRQTRGRRGKHDITAPSMLACLRG
jgi:hypothetical protein